MSANTKIVVLHMKRIVLACVIAGLLLIAAICLMAVLRPEDAPSDEALPTMYVPGVYTSSVQISDTALDVQVTVDENHINDISLVNLDETVETMYPLVRPAMEELEQQILSAQTLEGLSYSTGNQYTSIVLLGAIEDALKKAAPE